MKYGIQVFEDFGTNEQLARLAFQSMLRQDGCLGCRLLEPSAIKPTWRLQAIFPTNGDSPNGWLPDGCRHVVLLDSFLARLTPAEVPHV